MVRRHRLAWVLLFISVVLLLGALAAGWNVVLVQNYYHLVKTASGLTAEETKRPWFHVIAGTVGFLAATLGIVLFFLKVLKEMKLNQLQSEFIATVTHELKSPIATLELTASLLRAGGLPPEDVQKLWESHQEELHRLKDDVEALLEAARWQTNTIQLKPAPIVLESWLESCLLRWKQILGPSAVLLREGEALPCQADLDLRLLNLITDNLLDNARKFSKSHPHVTISSKLVPESGKATASGMPALWQIEIRDDGWGFYPTHSDKIFKRFFRSKNLAPYAIPGTGLGLHLAAVASHAMGITLRGKSEGIGQGATFILEGTGTHL